MAAPTLGVLIAEQAKRTPERVAVISGPEELTYRALDQQARRLAGYLSDLGVGPERLVGICMERSVELVVALVGVLYSGGAYLPLDPEHPRARLAQLMREAAPVALISSSSLRGRLPQSNAPVVEIDGQRERWLSAKPLCLEEVRPDHLAYLLYTSGSTGKPKGVMVEHHSIVNQLLWRAGAFALGDDDRVLQKAPLGFDVSAWELFCPLIAGAAVVMLPPGAQREPSVISEVIRRSGVTIASFTPSVLEILAGSGSVATWESVRILAVGGEQLRPALTDSVLGQAHPGMALYNLYGPTETTVISTCWRCRPGDSETPIGLPIANTTVHVLDGQRQEVPAGTQGELYIGGEGVARGYLNRPEFTAERFLTTAEGERLYRTGDLVTARADGNLLFQGRADDQVKIRGNRVEPGEVEAVLLQHPKLAKVAVVARADAGGGPVLAAYFVASDPASPPTPASLRAFLERQLPSYMIPSSFTGMPQLALDGNGKIDRRQLPAPGETAPDSYAAPQTRLQLQVAAAFQRVLGLRRVGLDDDFFALGGHSLAAIRLQVELEAQLGVSIGVTDLFVRDASVRRLAAALDDQLAGITHLRHSPAVDGEAAQHPALFFVHADEAAMLSLRHFVERLAPDQAVVGLLPERRRRRFDRRSTIASLSRGLVTEVRRQQPHGPYRLAGFSMGGLLAYEMAGQLLEAGEQVEWLGVYDAAYGPGAPLRGGPTTFVARLLRTVGRGPAAVGRTGMRLLSRRVRAALVRLHLLPVEADAFDYLGAAALERKYRTAGHRAPMTLFTSEASVLGTGSATLGWEGVHRGPLQAHAVPGGHLTMVTEPLVHEVTETTWTSLTRLPAAAGSRQTLESDAGVRRLTGTGGALPTVGEERPGGMRSVAAASKGGRA